MCTCTLFLDLLAFDFSDFYREEFSLVLLMFLCLPLHKNSLMTYFVGGRIIICFVFAMSIPFPCPGVNTAGVLSFIV